MTLPVYHLRRLLALTAIVLTLVVTGMYFYARSRATNVLKSLPHKIGYDLKQTASGFQISKSDGKRTLFTVQASDVKQFKLNGNAELHNVNIVLYGRDSSRFDQIYGEDFAYNQKTGDVTATGEVQIDLVANPAGLVSPDQSTPKELKNPIHLKTRNLVFNKDSGNAYTDARVEFRTPQASGWALGVKYSGKTNTLTLSSQLHLELTGTEAAVIEAEHGVVTGDPREIVLDHPRLDRESGTVRADQAAFYLSPENHVERVLATGNITTDLRTSRPRKPSRAHQTEAATEMQGRANQAEFVFVTDEDVLHTATLSGNVHFEETGSNPMQGDAGRVIFDFADDNQLKKVHATEGARLKQEGTGSESKIGNREDFELTAPVIDFTVANGRLLKHAATSGAAQIVIGQQPESGATTGQAQKSIVTAGRFDADFSTRGGRNHLSGVHGSPDARVVNSSPSQPDRVSTSDSVEALFAPQGGIESLTQTGNVHYSDGQPKGKLLEAWANSGHYTPTDQMLVLNGNPRVSSGGMATTADIMRMNRATGDALAEGNVKSTYSELKEQPDGALLSSSSPIHVTAQKMSVHSSPAVALYTGNARLWQDANIINAPSIQFDRNRRSVVAQGTRAQPVQTTLVQTDKAKGQRPAGDSIKAAPISITGLKLTYEDAERRAHYEGGVVAKEAEFTATAKTVDAYLVPRNQNTANQTGVGPGQLDRMVAAGDVVVQQPRRRAEGQKLVYTAAEDKFVLTGGPPSIFDAEQGKITGVSLTFFRRDDRVLVEGEASSSVVTQTRVAQ
jgi:lipopolysaccharide export system protein LptA